MDKKTSEMNETDVIEVTPEVKLKDIPEVELETPVKPKFDVVAVEIEGGGYGYHIMQDGNLFIKQEIVPSVQGKRTFKSETDALLVGEFVADKLRNGIMPPSISREEIEKLGVEIE